MTIWGVVSDIHGNLAALEAAAADCARLGATRFACLGDVIGRGDPEGCVAWVRDHADLAIVGNRDLDYLSRVSEPLQQVVRDWPNEALASDFVLSHGDPSLHRVLSSRAERDGFAHAASYAAERGAVLWLFGHTHRARAWTVADGTSESLEANVVEIRAGLQYVVNVGTTGLPLPGRGPASCIVYDDVARLLQFVPVEARQRTLTVGSARSSGRT
jgi:predicted phosphodiesterase